MALQQMVEGLVQENPLLLHIFACCFVIRTMSGYGAPSEMEQQQALMALQQMVEAQKESMKVMSKCFNKCVDVPGDELNYKEQQCIWQCTQRLFDTEAFLGKRLQAHAQRGAQG